MTRIHPGINQRAWWNRPLGLSAAVALLVTLSVALTFVRERRYGAYRAEAAVLYLSSGGVLQRLGLSFETLLADVYWIRAIQHYGSTKLLLAGEDAKDDEPETAHYELLYPLLDITTTLDPRFNVAYRFGAIFLTEAYPAGPGRPDQAIALLEKGFARMPEKWQYLMDIGFVYYWWLHDYQAAASWFQKASEVPGASWWLQPLAATTLVQGGDRNSSRMLWQQMYESADDNEWLRNEATRRLAQLRALDDIDQLTAAVRAFRDRTGQSPSSWEALVQAGILRGIPLDPGGHPYALTPETGAVDISMASPLFPLPTEPPTASPPPSPRPQ